MIPLQVKSWQCSTCKKIYATLSVAEQCCVCSSCRLPLDPTRDYQHLHHHCMEAQKIQREAKRFVEAERVADWTGWVYCEQVTSSNDGYYSDLGALMEQIQDDLDSGDLNIKDVPTHCLCTTSKPMRLDIQDFIERMCEDSYEDAYDDIKGKEELGAAIEKFNAANSGILTYYPDYKRIVVIDKSEFRFEKDNE